MMQMMQGMGTALAGGKGDSGNRSVSVSSQPKGSNHQIAESSNPQDCTSDGNVLVDTTSNDIAVSHEIPPVD